MKKKILLIPAVTLFIGLTSACGPLVTTGPDVMVGGGIYPPPVLIPPMGNPNAFRPGGPHGPGFAPGTINRPMQGKPNPGTNFRPGNSGQPGFNPNPGNQRQPGTGINFGSGNPGGNPGGGNPGGGNPGLPPQNRP